MKNEKEKGTEALEGSGERKPAEKKGEKKEEKKGGEGKKKGEKKSSIHEMRIRPLRDGSFHIEHHHQDEHGMPTGLPHEYSAASKQDLQDHIDEHMPEGGQDEGEEDEGAGGEQQAPAAAQQGASQPAAGGEEDE